MTDEQGGFAQLLHEDGGDVDDAREELRYRGDAGEMQGRCAGDT